MSLSYTHLLIPTSPQFRPATDDIVQFVRGLIAGGHVAKGACLSLVRFTKGPPRFHQVLDPATGGKVDVPCPSRALERPKTLSDPGQIAEQAANQQEYDVLLTSEGIPPAPPAIVGYVEDNEWKTMDDEYYLEIRCRVRAQAVRLDTLDSEEDLYRPFSLASYQPRSDEDCSPAEHPDGIYVHPEIGAFKVERAGCAKYWIEFNYGKFVFPRIKDGGVNILHDSVVRLARTVFECDFLQACGWG